MSEHIRMGRWTNQWNYFIDISEFLSVLRTVILNYSQYNKNIESFINANYILEDYIPVG